MYFLTPLRSRHISQPLLSAQELDALLHEPLYENHVDHEGDSAVACDGSCRHAQAQSLPAVVFSQA